MQIEAPTLNWSNIALKNFSPRYPHLFFPEMYLMKGGYKEFFNKGFVYQVFLHFLNITILFCDVYLRWSESVLADELHSDGR